MTSLKRTQTIWRIRGMGAPVLAAMSRLTRVKVPIAGIVAALSRLAEERVPLAGSKRR
jgi:hypothetical protein